MKENYVRLTVVFPVPYPDEENYWGVLMKDRMAGVFYPIPVVIEKSESFVMEVKEE